MVHVRFIAIDFIISVSHNPRSVDVALLANVCAPAVSPSLRFHLESLAKGLCLPYGHIIQHPKLARARGIMS